MPVIPAPATADETALHGDLVALRRHLHAHPELGFAEHETAAHLRRHLTALGLEPGPPIAGGTGFTVEVAGALPGPAVGYRTELDALEAPDRKGVPYRSTRPGAAHLCGHDAHMAVAVGVLRLLDARRERLRGRARVLFQPNEETSPSGAPRMIDDGAVDGLEALYCVHVDPSRPTGTFGLIAGTATAATLPWLVRVDSGAAGHSARPHETADTVWLATQILSAYYQLAGRVTDARRTAVLTACLLRGGEAFNVVPAEVEFGGTLRSTDLPTLEALRDRMRDVAQTTARLHGATAAFEAPPPFPPVVNDPDLTERVRRAVAARYGPGAAQEIAEPSMGGEDFAYYAAHVPCCLVRVGTAAGPDTAYPLHHTRFDVDEAALLPAAWVMADVLEDHLR